MQTSRHSAQSPALTCHFLTSSLGSTFLRNLSNMEGLSELSMFTQSPPCPKRLCTARDEASWLKRGRLALCYPTSLGSYAGTCAQLRKRNWPILLLLPIILRAPETFMHCDRCPPHPVLVACLSGWLMRCRCQRRAPGVINNTTECVYLHGICGAELFLTHALQVLRHRDSELRAHSPRAAWRRAGQSPACARVRLVRGGQCAVAAFCMEVASDRLMRLRIPPQRTGVSTNPAPV